MGDIELIVKRIRERRIELGMSYQDVADATGLSKSTIQRYETGAIRKVPINQIEDLARALHVTPSYLMGWDDSPRYFSDTDSIILLEELKRRPEFRVMFDSTKDLDPESIKKVVEFIEYQRHLEGLDK
jgi:transcriptional regulator with XRE-family HTH domain